MTRPTIDIDYTVLDCPDPAALATFYAELLGWTVVRSDDDWAQIDGPGMQRLAFQRAPKFEPVSWPASGIGVHLDLVIDDDYRESEPWALGLGATVVDAGDDHPTFRVYADPVGHLFCLCVRNE